MGLSFCVIINRFLEVYAIMSDQEYLQLVKGSLSFQDLDANLQAKILEAKGEDRENYIRTFQEEAELMKKAVGEFNAENDQVIADFKAVVQSEKTAKIKTAENKAKVEEEKQLSNLLNDL